MLVYWANKLVYSKMVKMALSKIKEQSIKLRDEALKKVSGYIAAAFGLVVGLAWNDAIKSLIDYFFPLQRETIWVKFIYAGVLTILMAIGAVFLVRLFKKDKK